MQTERERERTAQYVVVPGMNILSEKPRLPHQQAVRALAPPSRTEDAPIREKRLSAEELFVMR